MENPTEHQHSSTLKSLKTVLKHVETSKQWSSHGHPMMAIHSRFVSQRGHLPPAPKVP